MNIELAKLSTDLVVRATGLRVVDQQSLSLANELLLTGKGMVKKIKDFFAPLKQDAHASWKGICDKETEELAKITPAVIMLDHEIVNYRVEQDRIRREAEEKARRQEEERRRLEEQAFRRAQEKERQAREATERAAREENAAARKKAQEEAARAQAEADKIIAKAAAEEKKLEPAIVIPEKVVTTGTAIRHNWKFRVTDMSLVPLEYMLVNEVMIGKLVRASEGKVKILGIDPYDEPSTMNTR